MRNRFNINESEKNYIRGLHLSESKDKRITSVLNEGLKDFVIIDLNDGGKPIQEQLHEYLFTFLPEDISQADYPYDTLLEPLLDKELSIGELEELKNDLTAQIFGPDPYDESRFNEPDKTFKEGESLLHDLMDIKQILAFDKVIEYKKEGGDMGASTPKRETSWWKGEEGWIPDELQPHVNRPKVRKESINEQSYRYEGEKELSPTQQALHNDVMRYIGQTFGSWMSPDNPPFPQEYAQSPYFDNLSRGIRDIVIRNID